MHVQMKEGNQRSEFGDRKNLVDDSVSIGVNDELDININGLDESHLIQHEM